MSKILLELYDREPLNNILPFFHDSYDGVLFFCFANDSPTAQQKHTLCNYFERNFHITPVFITVHEYSLYSIITCFELNLKGNHDFIFDITGGSELFVLAVGNYIKQNPNLIVRQFDVRSGQLIFQIPPQYSLTPTHTELTFKDIIALNGGKLLSVSDGKRYDYSNEKLRTEIHKLWEAVKRIPNEWNRFCSLPYENSSADDKIVRRKLTRSTDLVQANRVLVELKEADIISSYFVDGNQIQYEYSKHWKSIFLLKKSGNILEMYSCLAAFDSGLFDDCNCGAVIDFDGIVSQIPGDPRNEIDVTMMYQHLPVFISCKNTQATKEHIYEIKAMTRHFGGREAIAVIFSSQKCHASTIERAKQTDVLLIDNISEMTYSVFKKRLEEITNVEHGHC